MKKDKVYLLYIKDCIEAVEKNIVGGKEAFLSNRQIRSATLRELQTLAESTLQLSEDLQKNHPEIPWKKMRGFRNILVHNYLGIDFELVWTMIQNDLPGLKKSVEKLIK